MCLYSKLIKNPKYKENKKNGGIIPAILDPRVLYVPIGCGKCMECKKRKAREWQVRLSEEIKQNNNGKFITLTFNNESIKELICKKELKNLKGYELDNGIATYAIRHFLERWRKKYSKSLRHWFVTELGHSGTENVHIHGIIWTEPEKLPDIRNIWNYGYIWPKYDQDYKTNYVNARTVNYITKYVNKTDEKHKYYNSKILTSPGIGSRYTKSHNAKNNIYKENETIETYRTESGHKIILPIYYRNKIYTEEQREKLWLSKLDKNERFVGGEKIKADDIQSYLSLIKHYRNVNEQLGYGNDEKNIDEIKYENQLREINYLKRLNDEKNKRHRKNNNNDNNDNN